MLEKTAVQKRTCLKLSSDREAYRLRHTPSCSGSMHVLRADFQSLAKGIVVLHLNLASLDLGFCITDRTMSIADLMLDSVTHDFAFVSTHSLVPQNFKLLPCSASPFFRFLSP